VGPQTNADRVLVFHRLRGGETSRVAPPHVQPFIFPAQRHPFAVCGASVGSATLAAVFWAHGSNRPTSTPVACSASRGSSAVLWLKTRFLKRALFWMAFRYFHEILEHTIRAAPNYPALRRRGASGAGNSGTAGRTLHPRHWLRPMRGRRLRLIRIFVYLRSVHRASPRPGILEAWPSHGVPAGHFGPAGCPGLGVAQYTGLTTVRLLLWKEKIGQFPAAQHCGELPGGELHLLFFLRVHGLTPLPFRRHAQGLLLTDHDNKTLNMRPPLPNSPPVKAGDLPNTYRPWDQSRNSRPNGATCSGPLDKKPKKRNRCPVPPPTISSNLSSSRARICLTG